ncbi:MAG: hypothetical protein A2X56_13300 [Nitrospirae bacterium GWC2_57_13]|jgi:adenylylsulfate kinase|nr:MAG: hypothetical protein A2072_05885 [Nitrospirae bacterium GWC1_57_7]OGW26997.1 MAG: hypothetical protein A2X56_13300 [Nitrospirae bacterium GWC2_57_13]OGW42469.1 MAG: hypothetical protein A2X57_06995 [Nitrospirae bacterium GWD2_57_8]HAR44619.1 adenylyl-sulfate kinase [Nitrospiraceae bacterium]HAS52809.1 adenylyl-sulfate kinase [Nitrospiraceae bacterium]
MKSSQGFAIWITGMPASGKSSITRELVRMLKEQGVAAAVLESDALRLILTPEPSYSDAERDGFYRKVAELGTLITRQGLNVIFDATANRRSYRERARTHIPRFLEAHVKCPIEICRDRDPKGIYARAAAGKAATVPGLQTTYEPPAEPEVLLDCKISPGENAQAILKILKELQYI